MASTADISSLYARMLGSFSRCLNCSTGISNLEMGHVHHYAVKCVRRRPLFLPGQHLSHTYDEEPRIEAFAKFNDHWDNHTSQTSRMISVAFRLAMRRFMQISWNLSFWTTVSLSDSATSQRPPACGSDTQREDIYSQTHRCIPPSIQ